MKYLYCKQKQKFSKQLSGISPNIFLPSIKRGFYLTGESRSYKILIVRILFYLMTLGKAKIYYLRSEEGDLVHTSYVIPRCYKFHFLDKSDYQIGPCVTYPQYRGNGYYPEMLQYICQIVGNEKTKFYISVDSSNQASINGIEKAGFKRVGEVSVSKLFKIYDVLD